MRILKIMLVVGIFALVGHFAPAEAQENPDHAANKLLVTSTLTWNQYQALGEAPEADQYAARLDLLQEIAANLEKIAADYPESSLAVDLVTTGVAGKLSVAEVAALSDALREKIRCVAAGEGCFGAVIQSVLALVFATAKTFENADARAMALA